MDPFHYLQFKEPRPTIPDYTLQTKFSGKLLCKILIILTVLTIFYVNCIFVSHIGGNSLLLGTYLEASFRIIHWATLTTNSPYSTNFLESSSKIFVKLCNIVSFLHH